MIAIKYIAHSPVHRDQEPHDLDVHIRGTYFLARRFSRSFDPYGITGIAAITHDSGKKTLPYRNYITSDTKIRGSVKHAIGGSIVLKVILDSAQDERVIMAAAMVAGHHAGLPYWRKVFDEMIPNAVEYLKSVPDLSHEEMVMVKDILKRFPGLPPVIKTSSGMIDRKATLAYRAMLMRLCFSALVDADFLDTERYFDLEKSRRRKSLPINLQQLDTQLHAYIVALREKAPDTEVKRLRDEVYVACREAAKQAVFFRALIVPTGLGKTLASVAFGLEHVKQFRKKRIIVALPLVNIIDQTAGVYKKVFGEHSVLEQHFQMSYADDQNETMGRAKLAAENWDAFPIIVTTTVELFESIFSNRTSKMRKLHRLSDSVIILDEFQKLPMHVLIPIFQALHVLMAHFNVTVVLCSATPLSFKRSELIGNIGEPVEICANRNELFAAMKRVDYIQLSEPLAVSELVMKLREHRQALCILNTRKDAYRVYGEAVRQKGNDQKVYHLSNRMCPHHRKRVIEQIREDLKCKKSILVIATALLEAGIDFDFPAVYRAMSPLDSIAQAAGRANREGGPSKGLVFIFELIGGGMPRGMYRKGAEQSKILLNQYGVEALHEPSIFDNYFRSLYALGGDNVLDEHGITNKAPLEFEEISRTFRMIEQDTVSLLCENYMPEKDRLAQLIRSGKDKPYVTKEWYREAQMYAVTIYRDSGFLKDNSEWLDDVAAGWYVWRGEYDSEAGIVDELGREEVGE